MFRKEAGVEHSREVRTALFVVGQRIEAGLQTGDHCRIQSIPLSHQLQLSPQF